MPVPQNDEEQCHLDLLKELSFREQNLLDGLIKQMAIANGTLRWNRLLLVLIACMVAIIMVFHR
jgi:hypothetical protein